MIFICKITCNGCRNSARVNFKKTDMMANMKQLDMSVYRRLRCRKCQKGYPKVVLEKCVTT